MEQSSEVTINIGNPSSIPPNPSEQSISISPPDVEEQNNGEIKHWIEQQRGIIIEVAILLVGLAINAAYTPRRGQWQDNSGYHRAGTSILSHENPGLYALFLIADATSFVASLSIITLLLCGCPLNRKLSVWFFMVLAWMAIMGIDVTYMVYRRVVESLYIEGAFQASIIIMVWFGLVIIFGVWHAIRQVYKAVKWLIHWLNSTPV